MIRFSSDYTEGAHPLILNKLLETNLEQTPGYGTDIYCEKARCSIKQICAKPDAAVQFLMGGTQTNLTVVSSLLRPHQGVIAADTGHINVHESGAIEATGHKILSVNSTDGKLTAQNIKELYKAHWRNENHEHMVQPGMVYISNPTETGLVYHKAELVALSTVCRDYRLPLYLDGARLGYGLMAPDNDLTLAEIADLCDIFYIGGTKVGALFGEALVIVNPELQKDFRYLIKQHGGMLAKGRLLGIQFEVLFTDDLYFKIAEHGVSLAMMLRNALIRQGCSFLYDSYTNQQFPILPDEQIEKLAPKYAFEIWQRIDETHSAVRFCTSWATKEADVRMLIDDINQI